jgi:hypothetical protein
LLVCRRDFKSPGEAFEEVFPAGEHDPDLMGIDLSGKNLAKNSLRIWDKTAAAFENC